MAELTKIKRPDLPTIEFKDLPEGVFFGYPDDVFGYPDDDSDVSIKLRDCYDDYNAISITTYNELYCALPDEKVIRLKPCNTIEFEIVEG